MSDPATRVDLDAILARANAAKPSGRAPRDVLPMALSSVEDIPAMASELTALRAEVERKTLALMELDAAVEAFFEVRGQKNYAPENPKPEWVEVVEEMHVTLRRHIRAALSPGGAV